VADRRSRRVDDLAAQADALKRRGLTWQQVEARLGKANPQARTHGLVREAVNQQRAYRIGAGARQAAQTRAQKAAAEQAERQRNRQAAPPAPGAQPIHWHQRGGGALQTDQTRYDLRYYDPEIGSTQTFSIYMPTIQGMSPEGHAARLAATIAQAQGPFTTEEISRIYSLVLDAIRAGNYSETHIGNVA
jgi:hypothetical protein